MITYYKSQSENIYIFGRNNTVHGTGYYKLSNYFPGLEGIWDSPEEVESSSEGPLTPISREEALDLIFPK